MRSSWSALAASVLLALPGCAPTGFYETTANVIDEMTAFRNARKQNTRAAWEEFARQYPYSSKASQARQWALTMPDAREDARAAQAELAKAERERAEAAKAAAALEASEAARRAEEERLKALADKRADELAKIAAAASEQVAQVQASTASTARELELARREEELARREAEVARREAAVAAAAVPVAPVLSDDVDAVPKGGMPAGEDDFAVVIGVEKYRDIDASAAYAEKDARTTMLYLRDHLGFPEENIKLLVGERASRSDFAKILELWLPLQVTKESRVFVYYSGHGAPDPKTQQAYLLPYDGDPKALELTAYPVGRLYEKLAALPAKEVVVALDSCFSGAGGRSVVAAGARPLMPVAETKALDPQKGLTVFAAASGEEITGSFEPQKHGLFTYFFLRGLRGDADADADGWVSVSEEYAYLKKNVTRHANRESREQTPQTLPDLAARRDKGAQRLAKAAK